MPNEDALRRAVAKPILASVFAASSETLALNALAEADIAADAAWDAVKTPEELAARQREMHARFVAALGGFPARTPLRAQVTGVIPNLGTAPRNYRIEKVVFQSQPGFYVTANVYVPEGGGDAPRAAILVPLGHTDNGKCGHSYQRMGMLGAAAGFVTMLYDPVDQGERVQSPDLLSPKGHNHSGALACRLGWCFARIRVWDAMRALDYLAGRPDVDGDRLCVAGISGGGTLTSLVMALDDRVKAAAPACYLSTLHDVFEHRFPSDAEQEHYGQLAFGLNHLGYLLLRAPMPVLVSCMTDDFFPYRGTMSTFAHAQALAKRLGWGERFAYVRATGPHSWPEGSKLASIDWFRHWARGDGNELPASFDGYRHHNVGYLFDNAYSYRQKPIDGFQADEALHATPGGTVLKLPGARTTADLFREELARLGRARAGRRPTPDAVARLAGIRRTGRPSSRCVVLESERVADMRVERLSFFTEDGAQLPATLLLPAAAKGAPRLVCSEEPRASRVPAALKSLSDGHAVLLPDLCGWGEIGTFRRKFFDQAVPDETLAMTWYPVGRSLVGIRAENLLDCAAYLKARFGAAPVLESGGRAVIPARHARFVAPELFDCARAESRLPSSWSDEVRANAKANFADAVHGALALYDWTDLEPVPEPRP